MARARYVIPFLGCEGPHDSAFLLPMLRKVFEQAALDEGFELLDSFLAPEYVSYSAGSQQSYADWLAETARRAVAYGDVDAVLCVHTDADGNFQRAFDKIDHARKALQAAGGLGTVVAVIPARTIEAWVLADPETLGRQLNPDLPVHHLGLVADPESYPDAKKKLRETHALAHADRRRRQPARIEVGELYAVMGAELSPAQLVGIPAFDKFMIEVEKAFRLLQASY